MKDDKSLILRTTCLFWIILKIAGYKIWLSEGRLYPVVPAFGFLDTLPPIVHSGLFILSLLGLLLIIIFPRRTFLQVASLIIIVLSCLPDILRWQPWEYQFIFFLIIFLIQRKNPTALYTSILFVMAAIYIYSGLQKFNGGFLFSVWENMILRRLFGLSTAHILAWKLHYAGLALPLIETSAGIALLVFKNKKLPIIVLIIMHVLIFFMLSGAGIDYNKIVLPWNVAMMLFLLFFYYKATSQFRMPLLLRGPNIIILLFWGILPALNFAGYWPGKFSSSLYSGRTTYMDICIKNPEAVPQLQQYFSKRDPYHACNGQARLSLHSWSSGETGLLPYPEEWYYEKFKTKWQKMYPEARAEFVMFSYPYKEKVVLK